MPTDRPDVGDLSQLNALVKTALADALSESNGAHDATSLVGIPARAAVGDQAAVETLGRGFARRDPIDGLDPLPDGRDSAVYSLAGISAGREPSLHWPELNAFRLSDDFPASPFDPVPAADHAARNVLPALFFPEAGPSIAPPLPSAAMDGMPPWLVHAPTPLTPTFVAPTTGFRKDFPALDQEVHGHRLVWLDSAATTQKPREVIGAISRFYQSDNSNVHRAAHELAARATDAYEKARGKVQRFLGARSEKEIIFVRGTTEAINLVAQSWGRAHVRAGDIILVTHLEHHSNIVPWQLLCEATGAALRVVPVNDAGEVRLDAYEAMLGPRVKLVALPHVSNALGTWVPVEAMAQMAHRHGARVLVDGAQSIAHVPVDVIALGADFFAFSGHKIYGPTGIGVLYGREDVLEEMPPWQGGGSMIENVTFERSTYAPLPARFEAGTPSLADAVGLGAALDYLDRIGRPTVFAHDQRLMTSLLAGLASVPGLSLIGAPMARVGAASFVIPGYEPQAIGQYLNRQGIAVRAGHHCAQPILRRFGHEATVRPSLGVYNDETDIALLVRALRQLVASAR